MAGFVNRMLATGFFVGELPGAPGTYGSLLALLLFMWIPGLAAPVSIILVTALGLLTTSIEGYRTGIKDESALVIDEMVGMWIVLAGLPRDWYWLLAAFFLFRIFDVLKPFPIGKLQDLPSGSGVMIDDIVAGVIVRLILFLINIYFF